MHLFPRRATAATITVLALSASAVPALASASAPHVTPVMAQTPLVARIAADTPLVQERYTLRRDGGPEVASGAGPNINECADVIHAVNLLSANSAQLPAKLEWLLGLYTQSRGDGLLDAGSHDEVSGHATAGARLIDRGFADFRLSNHYVAQADTLLGVRHPPLTAKPYMGDASAIREVTPVIAGSSLTATIAMGTPVITERITEYIGSGYYSVLRPNEIATEYYQLIVSRLHVDGAQRSAQQQWVQGVREQHLGDQMVVGGYYGTKPTGVRGVFAGFRTLRHANSEIHQADVRLGIHQSGPSVTFPQNIALP